MTSDASKWHWAEGMKYALEGIKIMFVINWASAVSILTFIGNTKDKPHLLVFSMVSFALGAAAGMPTMFFAYLTQLRYGNAEQYEEGSDGYNEMWRKAASFHYATYGFIIFGIVFFLVGVALAAFGLI